jgi:transposase
MAQHRRKFSEEFKLEAVRLAYGTDRSIAEVGRELDVRGEQIRRWRKKFEREVSFGPEGDPAEEVKRLRRELGRVKQEREILKKALAIFSEVQRCD